LVTSGPYFLLFVNPLWISYALFYSVLLVFLLFLTDSLLFVYSSPISCERKGEKASEFPMPFLCL
jgi:hypothetical protein